MFTSPNTIPKISTALNQNSNKIYLTDLSDGIYLYTVFLYPIRAVPKSTAEIAEVIKTLFPQLYLETPNKRYSP